MQGTIGLILVASCAALMLALAALRHKRRHAVFLRRIPAVERLRQAVGHSVEDGKRVHVALGNASAADPAMPSALAGLATLERITQASMVSDRPPIASSGEATLSILSRDFLRTSYKDNGVLERYNARRGQLPGVTPFSYAAGALSLVHDEQVSAHLLLGNFGPEVAFISDGADQEGAFVLAASDSLPAQAVMFAASAEPLIGEELYALPAYLNDRPFYQASLRVQDILRWGIIVVLVLGAILKWMGVL